MGYPCKTSQRNPPNSGPLTRLPRPLVPDLPAACLSKQAGRIPAFAGTKTFFTVFYKKSCLTSKKRI